MRIGPRPFQTGALAHGLQSRGAAVLQRGDAPEHRPDEILRAAPLPPGGLHRLHLQLPVQRRGHGHRAGNDQLRTGDRDQLRPHLHRLLHRRAHRDLHPLPGPVLRPAVPGRMRLRPPGHPVQERMGHRVPPAHPGQPHRQPLPLLRLPQGVRGRGPREVRPALPPVRGDGRRGPLRAGAGAGGREQHQGHGAQPALQERGGGPHRGRPPGRAARGFPHAQRPDRGQIPAHFR